MARTQAREGKLYMCAVKDVFSNRIIGYSIGDRMKSSLAVAAINNAVARRGDVSGCVVHSDYAEENVKPKNRSTAQCLRRTGAISSV